MITAEWSDPVQIRVVDMATLKLETRPLSWMILDGRKYYYVEEP